ncbi:MAG: hypothetical protein A3K68_03125 [Euryarchaeota archaeon RBG_16_68_13]|nr:MAG: hypothetical protein A3K68_03125 [Euryarchaeota archaeon RBG_16_68_13]
MSKLAANLVNRCLRIRPDDNVTIFCYPHTVPLAEDLATECFRAGADALLNLYTDRYYEAYMRLLPTESLRKPSAFCRGLSELSTAQFWLGALYDPAIFRTIPPERMAANDEGETAAHLPAAKEKRVRSLFVALGQVTRPRAKAYGFSYPAWEKMVREASGVSPDKLKEEGRRVARRLEGADRVRITSRSGTDLEFSVSGRKALVYDGVVDEEDIARGATDASVPAGSVAITIEETSANGTLASDVPVAWAGRTIRRMRWDFTDGRVTAFDGDANAKVLRRQWERATGDRDRIGLLSIGLNPKARLGFLQNAIARGAVTLAIGNNETIGGKNTGSFYFEQTPGDATIEIDGETLVGKGRLVGP